jgi:phosphoribosyl-ATP pyrophosphohydrolase
MQVELDASGDLLRRLPHLARGTAKLMEGRCSSLFEDVEEQSRQVLLRWQEDAAARVAGDNRADLVYIALASLVRVHIQRSLLARLNNQADTALREHILASTLCSEALEVLGHADLSTERITRLLASLQGPLVSRDPALPRVPTLNPVENADLAFGQVELYLATGEMAEELARAATLEDYASDCFERADAFYLTAIEQASTLVSQGVQDAGYLSRCYQRCMTLLDERSVANPDYYEKTSRTLLDLLKTQLSRLPGLLLPVEIS